MRPPPSCGLDLPHNKTTRTAVQWTYLVITAAGVGGDCPGAIVRGIVFGRADVQKAIVSISFNTLIPLSHETAAVTVFHRSRLSGPVRLALRYTTADIHCRDRRYEWDGGIRPLVTIRILDILVFMKIIRIWWKKGRQYKFAVGSLPYYLTFGVSSPSWDRVGPAVGFILDDRFNCIPTFGYCYDILSVCGLSSVFFLWRE